MELQDLKKRKEVQNETHTKIWCLKCKGNGHDKDHFSVYQNYLIGGGLVPLKLESTTGTSSTMVLW